MKRKLLLLLFIANLLVVNAQEWTYYSDFPVNVAPKDIVSNNSGILYMLTTDSRIYFKTLNGAWTEMDTEFSGPIAPVSITIDKDSNTLYVAEQLGGGIKKTSDFGASWQIEFMITDPITGFHETVDELSNVAENNTFYSRITLPDLILRIGKYTNNGQTIQFFEYAPSNNSVYEIAELLVAADDTVIMGTWNAGILVSENGGQTFQATGLNQHQIYKFTEDDAGRVYALGYNMAQDEIFMVTSDDYQNWDTMSLPNNTGRYTSIFYDEASATLWLTTETGIYNMKFIDGIPADEWIDASFNNEVQHTIEVITDATGTVYNISYQSIVQTLNPDDTWSTLNEGFTGVTDYIDFGADNKLFSATYNNNTISTLTDANSGWSNLFLNEGEIGTSSLHTKQNGNIYVNLSLALKKSNDNGITYSDITPDNLNNFITRFFVGEDNTLFVIKSNEVNTLYMSEDDGVTWTELHTFPNQITSVSEDSNGVIYVTFFDLDSLLGNYKVFYTTNNGITWNNATISVPDQANFDISIHSKNDITYAQIGVKTFIFDHSDESFTIVNGPDGTDVLLGYLVIDNDNNYYVFTDNLYKSVNGGASWINLSKPATMTLPYLVNKITFDSNNTPYIVTSSTGFAEDKGIYFVTENLSTEQPVTNSLFTVYPNPATNTIMLSNIEKIQHMAVYDALGKEIARINRPAGSIDVSGYANGIYFLKITAVNGAVYNVKVVKQ